VGRGRWGGAQRERTNQKQRGKIYGFSGWMEMYGLAEKDDSSWNRQSFERPPRKKNVLGMRVGRGFGGKKEVGQERKEGGGNNCH